jgi:putative transposase
VCAEIPNPVRVASPLFGWQNGYGMFSIGASQIEDARRHLAQQEQQNRKLSFQDGFPLLLKRHELAYDDRYVGD